MTRSAQLLENSKTFCDALLSPPPPRELLSQYFTSANPRITEHGPEWSRSRLPFLAHTFFGLDGCEEYFNLLSETLEMNMDAVEGGDSAFTINEHGGEDGKGLVFVQAGGVFKSIKTGRSWREKFVYRLSGFDEQGKIGHWEIWADPLSAWNAVQE